MFEKTKSGKNMDLKVQQKIFFYRNTKNMQKIRWHI